MIVILPLTVNPELMFVKDLMQYALLMDQNAKDKVKEMTSLSRYYWGYLKKKCLVVLLLLTC